MSDWTPSTIDPRIQIRSVYEPFGGLVGYQARWELPIPASRGRCLICRKDLVIVDRGFGDERLYKHVCDSPIAGPRGYEYVKRRGRLRLFGTLTHAVAVALDKAGFTIQPEQIESRVLQ